MQMNSIILVLKGQTNMKVFVHTILSLVFTGVITFQFFLEKFFASKCRDSEYWSLFIELEDNALLDNFSSRVSQLLNCLLLLLIAV